MFQRMFVASVVVVTVAIGSADLTACGDKFLRVGRSARFRGYAAIHPASILFYKPKNSTPAGIKEFEALLKRAGHTSVTVENGTPLSPIFAATEYDLVIADFTDTGKIKEELRSVAPDLGLLPILYKPTKAVATEAEKAYHHVIKPDAMSKHDALAEIDHVMELRLKKTTAADGTR